jgi:hypothetical protein
MSTGKAEARENGLPKTEKCTPTLNLKDYQTITRVFLFVLFLVL